MSLFTEESTAEICRINDILKRFVSHEGHYSSNSTWQFPMMSVYYFVELNQSCLTNLHTDGTYHLRLMRQNVWCKTKSVQIVAQIEIQVTSDLVQIFSASRFNVFDTQDLYTGSIIINDNKNFIQILLHLLIFCCAAARSKIQFSVQDTALVSLCSHVEQYRKYMIKELHHTTPYTHPDEHVNSARHGSFFIDMSCDKDALHNDCVIDIKNLACANVHALLQMCACNISKIFQ